MNSLAARLRRALSIALSCLALIGTAWASPALDLFDEAAYHLALLHGGPSEARPGDLLPVARDVLAERCNVRLDCPEEEAVAVLLDVIDALDDAHTGLMPAPSFDRLELELAGGGSVESFGLVIRAPTNGLGVVVLDVLAGSSAEREGVRRGDRILGFDDGFLPANLDGRYLGFVEAEARGSAEALVLRSGDAPRSVPLAADAVALERPPTLDFIDDVAWIRVPTFFPALDVAPAFHALLREAGGAAAAGLIVDLRDNLGGALNACLAASAAFVDEPGRNVEGRLRQTVLVEDGAVMVIDGAWRRFPQPGPVDPMRWSAPAVVLVNAWSASCAEFMAFDLQRAGFTVVGEPTVGVPDSVTTFIRLPNGMGLAVTSATVRDLAGDRVPARVTPDEVVADDLMRLADGEDQVLDAALELLRGVAER